MKRELICTIILHRKICMCCVWLCVLRVCMCVALSLELYNGYAKWFSLTAGAIFLLFLLLPAAATFSSRPFQWFPPPTPPALSVCLERVQL